MSFLKIAFCLILFIDHDCGSTCFQHKEFKEIEERVQRREPLISGSKTAQKLSHHLATEVMSDPLSDSENDLYEDASDVQNEHGVYQVYFLLLLAKM